MMANGRIRPLWPVLLSILLALLVSGCSDSNENSGLSLVDEQGNHPSNFISTHPGYAVAEINQCTPCHGDDLTGGISKQSCFLSACHHGTEVGWVVFPSGPPQGHGNSAKAAPSIGEGYPACQICHAVDFSGGGAQVTCLSASCHGGPGTSPHPSQWRSVDTYVHTNTNEENASVCAQCHLNGNNSPIGPPSPPATAGTPPGCFNSTLCHSENPVPHPVGNPDWWTTIPAAQPHGNDAKAVPGATTGFAYCQVCHGTPDGDFSAGSATSCYPCHGASAPHPSEWLTGAIYVHTSTEEGNASVCGFCHYGESAGGNHDPVAPPAGSGCFNGTLCHAVPVPHPVDNTWVAAIGDPQPHGNDAKAAATTSSGFLYCQSCHGSGSGFNAFAGGLSEVSCYTCHNPPLPVPHPPGSQWETSGGYTHRNTDPSNAAVCAYCHQSSPGTPGCFNSTLCH